MKKFLTLALALVLAFAMASTALAAGWDDISDPEDFTGIGMELYPLSLTKNATNIYDYDSAYTVLSQTYPVVGGQRIHAGVTVTIPQWRGYSAVSGLDPEVKEYMENGQVQLRLKYTNLDDSGKAGIRAETSVRGGYATYIENANGVTTDGLLAKADEEGVTIVIPFDAAGLGTNSSSSGRKFYVDIWGTADADAKDVTVTASIGIYNEWRGGVTNIFSEELANYVASDVDNIATAATGTNAYFSFEANGEDYTVVHNTDANTFAVVNTDSLEGFRFYYRGSKGLLDEQAGDVVRYYNFTDDTCTAYKVVKAHTTSGVYAFDHPADSTDITATNKYSSLNGTLTDILEEIHSALGFAYDGTKYMQEDHYENFFGKVQEYTEQEVWGSGYIAELVVDEPTVNPPQTGDNASIAGFVMIAVALVAAAVITIKKVRA